MHLVKLVVLGGPGVGKTSLIEQFLRNEFGEHGETSKSGDTYNFSIIMNSNLFHVKIIDMPMINYFPANAFYEWTDYRGCALRSADAYLLLFDLTSPGTFHYIKVIRDQLFESRNMQNIPVWVLANKADLCTSILTTMRGSGHHHHHQQQQQQQNPHLPVYHHSHHDDLTPALRDLANLVKKHWKCSYIECSAKYNWRVVPIFKDIMKTLEGTLSRDSDSDHHQRDSDHGESFKITFSGHSGAHRTVNNSTSNHNTDKSCVIL